MGNCGSSKKKQQKQQQQQQSLHHKTGKSQKTKDEVGLEPPSVPLSPQVARGSSKKKLLDSKDPAKTLLSPSSNPKDEPPDETSPPTPVSSKAVIPDSLDAKQNETAESDNTTDKKVSIEGIRPNVMVFNTRKQIRERI